MRVLLISPFFESPQYPLYMPSENLGLSYVAASLRFHNFDVDILDANLLELPSYNINEHLPHKPYGLAGISCSSQVLFDETVAIAHQLKRLSPTIHVTVGGHFASIQHIPILENITAIDSVVRGDGEETSVLLAKALYSKADLEHISGLTFRGPYGTVVVNEQRPFVENLDHLPWPARDTLENLKSLGHTWPTQISSSRGCYANCSFCDIRTFYGRFWRARSAQDVVNEIEWLNKEYGSQTFRFSDDEFFGPPRDNSNRSQEIALEILKRRLRIKLMLVARANAVEKSLFSLLKEAGMVDCLIGVESGVDRLLKLYSKGASVDTNLQAISILKDLNVGLNLAFIMFDPRMSFIELRENYQFLMHNDIVTADSLKSRLWPLYGTPVVEQLRTAGLTTHETISEIGYRFANDLVGKVFQAICRYSEILFPFEQHLFLAKKNGLLHESRIAILNDHNNLLWADIFRQVTRDPLVEMDEWVANQNRNLMYQLTRTYSNQ